jgi:hypothetical protein
MTSDAVKAQSLRLLLGLTALLLVYHLFIFPIPGRLSSKAGSSCLFF